MTRHLSRLLALILLLPLGWACGGGEGSDADTSGLPDTIQPDTGGGDSVVQPDGAGTNAPPSLFKIGDKVVAVGQTLTITLKAEDPDGDPLRYSVYGDVPRDARFLKDIGEFSWTPAAGDAGASVFLTFVVSDGQAFDRETVEIAVTAEAGQHAPVFTKLGDQSVEVGKSYTWQLVATDPDSDTLTYQAVGALPPGMTLAAQTGKLSWSVPAGAEGQTFRVRFVVSDGALTDQLEVAFVVAGAQGSGHAPVFAPMADVEVVAGQTVDLSVQASDVDDDPLVYGVEGALPPGASFDAATRRFTWPTTQAHAGKSWDVTFRVTDGAFTAYLELGITVTKPAQACTTDAQEPNDQAGQAKVLPTGAAQTLRLCPQGGVPDQDRFRVTLAAGARLTVRSETAAGVNIDLEIFAAQAPTDILSFGYQTGPQDMARYTATAAGDYLVLAYQYGGDPGSDTAAYTLTATIEAGYQCSDDTFEQNDTLGSAWEIPWNYLGTDIGPLRVCPNDPDYYALDLECGQSLTALIDFVHAEGDLDLYLYGPDSPDLAIARSETEDDGELVELPAALRAGRYSLKVVGFPAEGTENAYSLVVETGAATPCAADPLEPNDDQGQATALPDEASWASLTSCCDEDWFVVTLASGDALLAEAPGTPLLLKGANGQATLASGTGSVEHTAASAGDVYLVVPGGAGAYSLDVIVVRGAGTCTAQSCPTFSVCDEGTGECVADYCSTDFDCPGIYFCLDTFCVDECTSVADCRPEYGCKSFEDGLFCAPAGDQALGEGCYSTSDCGADLVCRLLPYGGACTRPCADDASCPQGSACTDPGEGKVCLPTCQSDADCRTSEGFGCQTNSEGTKVCAPLTWI